MSMFGGIIRHIPRFRGAIVWDERNIPIFPEIPDEPVSPGERWEVLIDRTVTTKAYGTGDTIGSDYAILITDYPLFTQPCRVRLTVDGIATVLTCEVSYSNDTYRYYIGNKNLEYPDCADNGYDFFWEGQYVPTSGGAYCIYFYSRAVGTYNVKLEKEI